MAQRENFSRRKKGKCPNEKQQRKLRFITLHQFHGFAVFIQLRLKTDVRMNYIKTQILLTNIPSLL